MKKAAVKSTALVVGALLAQGEVRNNTQSLEIANFNNNAAALLQRKQSGIQVTKNSVQAGYATAPSPRF